MTLPKKIVRRGALLEAEIDGELIGLDVDQGVCFGFNRPASRIWTLLEQPRTLDELIDLLVAEFDVQPAACALDLAAFLRELEADGLVRFSANAVATPAER